MIIFMSLIGFWNLIIFDLFYLFSIFSVYCSINFYLNLFTNNYEHIPRKQINESEKKNAQLKVNEKKKRKCGMVVDAQILLMMSQKILFWANPVLSGFTSDVKAWRKLPKLQNIFVVNVTHFNWHTINYVY